MISYAMITKPGSRKRNEDSILMCEKKGCWAFVLADGLGGHGRGDTASAAVTDQAIKVFKRNGAGESYLDDAFRCAQGWLLQKKAALGITEEMKSTMVVLQITKEYARWAHIGDSRLYYFQGGHLVKRSLDHSVPQMLVFSGQIKEEEIRDHEDRNKVLRVLGTPWEGPSYEIGEPVALTGDQAFLLCSDGFWELITEKEMEKTLKQSKSVAQWMNKMEKIVEKNGADREMDNYSAVCVYIS